MKEKELSIIIPYFNASRHLKMLLDSLITANCIDVCEVITVDDGSFLNLQNDFTGKYPENFMFHRLEKNSGPATARNYGASTAQTNNLLFLDVDTTVFKDTLENCIHTFKNSNEEIFVGNISEEVIGNNFFQKYKSYIELYWKPETDYTTVVDTKVFGIKKYIFDAAGGFNTTYKGAEVEDYEFGYRLMSMNYKIALSKSIRVMHDHADLFSFFKKCYTRVRLWILLKKQYHRGFDNYGTSITVAIGQIAGFLSIFFFAGIFFESLFVFPFAISIILFFLITQKFWKLIFANRENILFISYALFCYLVLTIPVIAGAFMGYVTYYLSWKKKSK